MALQTGSPAHKILMFLDKRAEASVAEFGADFLSQIYGSRGQETARLALLRLILSGCVNVTLGRKRKPGEQAIQRVIHITADGRDELDSCATRKKKHQARARKNKRLARRFLLDTTLIQRFEEQGMKRVRGSSFPGAPGGRAPIDDRCRNLYVLDPCPNPVCQRQSGQDVVVLHDGKFTVFVVTCQCRNQYEIAGPERVSTTNTSRGQLERFVASKREAR